MLGYHLVPNGFLFATFSSFFLSLDIICENDEKNGDANHRRTIKNSETNVKHVQAAWLGDYCDMTVEKKNIGSCGEINVCSEVLELGFLT